MVSSQSWAALVVGLLSLFVRVNVIKTEWIGEVASCSHVDFAGMGLGGLAVLLALGAGRDVATGLIAYKPQLHKGATLAVAVLGLVLGVVGLLRGFDVIMSPCG